ncbi:hypothetical protein BH20CHL1_BH20CHL1_02160 [soil metagenome]|jgi:hypothetical protein
MSRPARLSRSESESELRAVHVERGPRQVIEEEGIQLGCIMLSKVRRRFKNPNVSVSMRCSLGFALRTSDDVCKCMDVTGPSGCWKKETSWRVVGEEPSTRG